MLKMSILKSNIVKQFKFVLRCEILYSLIKNFCLIKPFSSHLFHSGKDFFQQFRPKLTSSLTYIPIYPT